MDNNSLLKFVRNISDRFIDDSSDENRSYCDSVVKTVERMVTSGSIQIINKPGYNRTVKSYWSSGKPVDQYGYQGKAGYMRDVVGYSETNNDQELILSEIIVDLDALL